MKRRNVTFDPDLAEGSLELVELAFASVPAYDAGWEHIHPEDQAEWLASFEGVRRHLAQLQAWDADAFLDDEQQARLLPLNHQQEVVAAVLERLSSATAPPRRVQARLAAAQSLWLDD